MNSVWPASGSGGRVVAVGCGEPVGSPPGVDVASAAGVGSTGTVVAVGCAASAHAARMKRPVSMSANRAIFRPVILVIGSICLQAYGPRFQTGAARVGQIYSQKVVAAYARLCRSLRRANLIRLLTSRLRVNDG